MSLSSLTYSPPLYSSSSLVSSVSAPSLPLHTPQFPSLTQSPSVKLDAESLESKSSDAAATAGDKDSASSSAVPASALSILTSMKTIGQSNSSTTTAAAATGSSPTSHSLSASHSHGLASSLPVSSTAVSSLARRSSYSSSSFSPAFGSSGFKSNLLTSMVSSNGNLDSLKEITSSLQDSLAAFPVPSAEIRSAAQANPAFNAFIDSAIGFRSAIESVLGRLNELKSSFSGELPSLEGIMSPTKSSSLDNGSASVSGLGLNNSTGSGLGISKNLADSGMSFHLLNHASPSSKLSVPFVSASPSPTGAFHSTRSSLPGSSTFKSPVFSSLGHPASGVIPSLNHSSHSTSFYPSVSPLFTSNSTGSGPVGISPRINGLNSTSFISSSSLTPLTRIPSAELPGSQQPAPSSLSLTTSLPSPDSSHLAAPNRPPSPPEPQNTVTIQQQQPPSHPAPSSHSHSHSQSRSSSKAARASSSAQNGDQVFKAKRGRGRLQKCEKHRKWKKSCPPTCPDKPKPYDGVSVRDGHGSASDSGSASGSDSDDSGSGSDSESNSDSNDSSSSSDSSRSRSRSRSAERKKKRERERDRSAKGKQAKISKLSVHTNGATQATDFNGPNSMSSHSQAHSMSLSLPIPSSSPTAASMNQFPISPYNSASILGHLQIGTQPGGQPMFAPAPFTPANAQLFQQAAAGTTPGSLVHSQSSPFFMSPANRAINFAAPPNGASNGLNQSSPNSVPVPGVPFQPYDLMSPPNLGGNPRRF